jgi:hypothetical protein
MIVGTIGTFLAEAGKHTDADGNECAGRDFSVVAAGTRGGYLNYVRCVFCSKEFRAWEHGQIRVEPEGMGLESPARLSNR